MRIVVLTTIENGEYAYDQFVIVDFKIDDRFVLGYVPNAIAEMWSWGALMWNVRQAFEALLNLYDALLSAQKSGFQIFAKVLSGFNKIVKYEIEI